MTTDNLVPDLIADEGFKLFPYKDSRGIWTIYAGHNMQADPAMMTKLAFYQQHGGSRIEGLQILNADIFKAEQSLDRDIAWWRKLSDIRQDVMVELAFNLGAGKLATWKHTLGDIEAGNFKAAEIDLETDEPWASQVHERAFRLALQMETNIHQPR